MTELQEEAKAIKSTEGVKTHAIGFAITDDEEEYEEDYEEDD